jgi:hypothetical protein
MSDPVPVSERLKRGAAILGDLWRKGVHCNEEWGVLCPEEDPFKAVDCFCDPKTPFCKAKKQWLDMASREGRDLVQGPFGLMITMEGSEWDASGLSVKFDFPDVGAHLIGPKGIMGRQDMIKLTESPDALASIVRMMKAFPGMKVEEVSNPAEPVPVPAATEEDFWKAP